jgi:hypothetical protein
LYRRREKDLVSVFYLWISSFPAPFVEKAVFSDVCFWNLSWESVGSDFMSLFQHTLSERKATQQRFTSGYKLAFQNGRPSISSSWNDNLE